MQDTNLSFSPSLVEDKPRSNFWTMFNRVKLSFISSPEPGSPTNDGDYRQPFDAYNQSFSTVPLISFSSQKKTKTE